MSDERIVFLGTPDMAAQALKALVESGFNVVGVVSQPDSPKGRSHTPTPSPVSAMALELGIPLHRPVKLNHDYDFVARLKPDVLLTFAFGQILSSKVLALSGKFPPLNVHASDLPRLRGASPIQTAILEGDRETAVCLMEMVKAMDAGRVFARQKVAIAAEDNTTTLSAKIVSVAIRMLREYLPKYFSNQLVGEVQDEGAATVCHILKKEDSLLTPDLSPASFVNKVRAFALKPGAFLRLDGGLEIKVYRCVGLLDGKDHGQGVVEKAQDGEFVIGLKGGYVKLLTLQKPGKKAMDAKAFLNGERGLAGKRMLGVDEVFPTQTNGDSTPERK